MFQETSSSHRWHTCRVGFWLEAPPSPPGAYLQGRGLRRSPPPPPGAPLLPRGAVGPGCVRVGARGGPPGQQWGGGVLKGAPPPPPGHTCSPWRGGGPGFRGRRPRIGPPRNLRFGGFRGEFSTSLDWKKFKILKFSSCFFGSSAAGELF